MNIFSDISNIFLLTFCQILECNFFQGLKSGFVSLLSTIIAFFILAKLVLTIVFFISIILVGCLVEDFQAAGKLCAKCAWKVCLTV